jgi:competence protein ComEC
VSLDPAPRERVDVRLVPAALTGWAVTGAGILWPTGMLVPAASALAAAVILWARRRLPGSVSGALALCLIAVGFGAAVALRTHYVGQHPLTVRFGGVAEVAVTPTESPRPVGRGRVLFAATLQLLDGVRAPGRVTVFASGPAFADVAAGRPMTFSARISRPHRHDLTVATLTATGLPQFGRAPPVHAVARAVRDDFAAAASDVLPAAQAAMLPALVLGDTSAVTEAGVTEFRTAGLTHLTAVSGANVTIVCGAVLLSAGWVGPRVAVGLAAITLTAFVIVVEPTASVLRAAVMGAVTLLGILTARRRQAVPALAASVLFLLTVAPQLAVDAGFALSVSATAALVLLAPVWSRRLVSCGWPKPLADAVAVAAAAQLVTAPLIAGISGQLSLVAILANLLVAPVIAPITVLGTAAAVHAGWLPSVAHLMIRFTGPELWWLLAVSRWAARIPGAALAVPSGGPGGGGIGVGADETVLLARRRAGRVGVGVLAVVAAVLLAGWSISGWLAGSQLGAVGPP